MGQPSHPASNALIYCSYAAFLVFGLFIAWRLRGQCAGEWLSANRTQKAFPLALNFIASGEFGLDAPRIIVSSGRRQAGWKCPETTSSNTKVRTHAFRDIALSAMILGSFARRVMCSTAGAKGNILQVLCSRYLTDCCTKLRRTAMTRSR
ncbi:hypothetical protein AC578_8326 [Pseudocercospora eumusae]|uniref:Uncharacterized protein n=1 Tax=Pseudocercospora eumusae TaxID=321146 RepID=A0A139GTZ1_9PEZI|nr:hypothetical protein AC578_8326 [Pseudocercospora eumusae]